ncbi:hypothetical protein [Methylosinus sp. PW1]|uniref:hypothetical protein n=1 Tax=Methylosinus sp. PW1 TaxID=107636 RepID=UPI00055F290F|nr:hypothetical protein [Methylosinus sp. PW1]
MSLSALEAIEWAAVIEQSGGLRGDRRDDVLAGDLVSRINETSKADPAQRQFLVRGMLSLNPGAAAAMERIVERLSKESL